MKRRDFLRHSALALGAGAVAGLGCAPRRRSEDRPNILFLSLDTTCADHLSCYGYHRDTSRSLDALAAESVFFTQAISTSSWTLPAHLSMFTGKFVTSHGVRKDEEAGDSLLDAFDAEDVMSSYAKYRVRAIPSGETLLTEYLRDAGYDTSAVIAGPWLKRRFGFNRGFTHFDDENIYGLRSDQMRLAPEITDRAIEWLRGRENEQRPFFLFLNYFDPHAPYVYPSELNNFAPPTGDPDPNVELRRQYDIEILFMDFAIGRLIEHLKQNGLYDNTLILAIGDHGELFGEHGINGHGKHLYHPLLHVPFFVKYPHGERDYTAVDDHVQPLEVVPLLLDRLNLPAWDGVQGDLYTDMQHPILAEAYPTRAEVDSGHWQALYRDNLKLLFSSKGDHRLYDLAADPTESVNLYESEPDLAARMTQQLAETMNTLPKPENAGTMLDIDPATLEELKALGYM